MTALVASPGFVPMAFDRHRRRSAEADRDRGDRRAYQRDLLTLFVLPALYVRFGRDASAPQRDDDHVELRAAAE